MTVFYIRKRNGDKFYTVTILALFLVTLILTTEKN